MPRERRLFPLHAWWVRQGFDSGIVLINRTACAPQLRTLCVVARSPQHRVLRSISLVRSCVHVCVAFTRINSKDPCVLVAVPFL